MVATATATFEETGERGVASGRPDQDVGTQIGSYKLLEQIGEGGFGVVFMAEQTQPVRRRVALKDAVLRGEVLDQLRNSPVGSGGKTPSSGERHARSTIGVWGGAEDRGVVGNTRARAWC